jgi:soluble lytic murein transglycosylase-like protein
MEGRFSATLEGVVVKREKRSDPLVARVSDMTASKQKLVATIDRSGDAAKTKSASELEALERQVYRVLKRHGKPVQNGKELAGAIVREALLQDYDPVFVAAVIKSESAFNSLARSHKGAQGLMQIMPKTGAWLADQHAIPRRKLTDPGHNLKLGISYLKQLEREYGGNRVLTLIAYNWGPGHVASASAGGRRVPGEVMQYAVKILNDYRRWSSELRSSVG